MVDFSLNTLLSSKEESSYSLTTFIGLVFKCTLAQKSSSELNESYFSLQFYSTRTFYLPLTPLTSPWPSKKS